MIKNTLGLAVLALCMFSCSPDTTEISNETQTKGISKLLKTEINPENPANPYDSTGKVYYQLLLEMNYGSAWSNIHDVVSAVESHALLNDEFKILAGKSYFAISQGQEEFIAGVDSNVVLGNPQLSVVAREHLRFLFSKFSAPDYTQQEFDLFCNSLKGFEHNVLLDVKLNSYDKKVVLTTATIARYAAARDKGKGKDKDWRLSTNNIVAAAVGAMESEAKAVTMAMAEGIYNAGGI
ncbi:hypothetical protein [Flavobacterium psychrotrophum]|uniref:hypothetical protein n=1 Tax=Flavobacterium psychrotrophum TaxID=2294119 RepID=UPI000E31EFA0|nr:hypothetical protein [Flavobacterium psychrotrophum]